jgi:bacillithiol system protein YtxJ
MHWIPLEYPEQLQDIKNRSEKRPQLLFKHSTRCSISVMAKSRLDRGPSSDQIDYYYLDLLQFRPISNQIAELFQVHHESPQVLLIKNGQCVYEETHNGITAEEILEQAGLQ